MLGAGSGAFRLVSSTQRYSERLINRLKQYRRVATRYEKRAAHYLAKLTLALAGSEDAETHEEEDRRHRPAGRCLRTPLTPDQAHVCEALRKRQVAPARQVGPERRIAHGEFCGHR